MKCWVFFSFIQTKVLWEIRWSAIPHGCSETQCRVTICDVTVPQWHWLKWYFFWSKLLLSLYRDGNVNTHLYIKCWCCKNPLYTQKLQPFFSKLCDFYWVFIMCQEWPWAMSLKMQYSSSLSSFLCHKWLTIRRNWFWDI